MATKKLPARMTSKHMKSRMGIACNLQIFKNRFSLLFLLGVKKMLKDCFLKKLEKEYEQGERIVFDVIELLS